MRRLSAPVLLLMAALAGAEDLVLACPADASLEEATQASDRLKARLEAWGYLDLTSRAFVRDPEGKEVLEATPGSRWFVAVSAKSDFTEPMRRRILAFASIPARTLEFRHIRNSSVAEEEQFPPGAWDRPEDDRAPAGAAWHRMVRWDSSADVAETDGRKTGPMVLLNDEVAVARQDLVDWRRTDGPPERRKYTIHVGGKSGGRLQKWIHEGPAGTTWRLCLVVDGKAMNLGDLVATASGNTANQAFITLAYEHGRWIRALTLFPLPFPLTAAK